MARTLQAIGCAMLVMAAGACAPSPSPSPSATALPSNPLGIPAGQPVRIGLGVGMSADNRGVTLQFEGGVVLPPGAPCSTEYEGWAMPAGDVLQVAVVLVRAVPPPSGSECAAAAMERDVLVTLAEAFVGLFANDVVFGSPITIERRTPEPSRGGGGA